MRGNWAAETGEIFTRLFQTEYKKYIYAYVNTYWHTNSCCEEFIIHLTKLYRHFQRTSSHTQTHIHSHNYSKKSEMASHKLENQYLLF